MPSPRIHQLDLLRALLMMLGVVIHAAFVFVTERSWLIAESETARVFDYIVLIINVFRMPAFFLISGYLFALVLARQTVWTCMSVRLRRIGIPLVVVGLLLNAPQLWLLDVFGPEYQGAAIVRNNCSTLFTIYSGCWLIHLWFLSTLAYFFLIGSIIHLLLPLVKALPRIRIPAANSMWWPLTVVTFAVFSYPIQSLYWRLDDQLLAYLPLFSADRTFMLLPFFLVGFFIHRAYENFQAWAVWSPLATIFLLLSWSGLLVGFSTSGLDRAEFLYGSRNTTLLAYAVAFQTSVAMIVAISKVKLRSPESTTYLADASYTIYLTHHLLVFLTALWLTTIALPITVKFALIFSFALTVSWLFHHFIVRRFAVLKLLFNGRTIKRPADRSNSS